jgi:GntR family transcriptional regulator
MKNLVTPLYLEIKQWLMKEIENAPINSPIPSERELSKIFHTSRMTVRNAVNELVAEGFLYRNKTKGTFVADKSLLKKNTAAEVLKSEHDSEYTIIYFNIRAIPEIAPALNLLDHERILRVVRVFSEQEQPVTVEEIYFPFENVQSVQKTNRNYFIIFPNC